MSFLVSHDIPLSTQTREAWKSQGGVVLQRHRSRRDIERLMAYHQDLEFILNLGSAISTDTFNDIIVINPNPIVAPLWDPLSTRTTLDHLLPPVPQPGDLDYWLKAVGRAGRGKQRITDVPYHEPYRFYGDVQKHIEGQEYRTITVGGRIVQQFSRSGPNGSRVYRWVPREELPDTITDITARAAREFGTYTLIAWDLIDAGQQAYVFEGNCCPGVKEPTAARIVNAIRRLTNA